VSKLPANRDSVFLNIPYDKKFEPLYLAYLVGVTELGLSPKATSGIPGGQARIERIFELVQSCRYSIHDLSRVELDRKSPATPRFNMPFELGLSVAWAKLNPGRHSWAVFESKKFRMQKSLSDLSGTDCYIHDGTIKGVMRQLSNYFSRDGQPTVPQMMSTYRKLRSLLPRLMHNAGTNTPFEAKIFDVIIVSCAEIRDSREPQ
jgi:hypothetical protein